jgi:hypothetical protein
MSLLPVSHFLSTSVRGGLPPAQDIEDFDVKLPATKLDNERDPQSQNEDKCLVYFQLLCRLCVIKSRVYQQLYSSNQWKISIKDRFGRVDDLNKELEEWRETNPFSKSESLQEVEVGDPLTRLWYIRIQLSYFHTMMMINRTHAVIHGLLLAKSARKSKPPPDLSVIPTPTYQSDGVVLGACRSSLKLLSLFPRGDIVWIWYVS